MSVTLTFGKDAGWQPGWEMPDDTSAFYYVLAKNASIKTKFVFFTVATLSINKKGEKLWSVLDQASAKNEWLVLSWCRSSERQDLKSLMLAMSGASGLVYPGYVEGWYEKFSQFMGMNK